MLIAVGAKRFLHPRRRAAARPPIVRAKVLVGDVEQVARVRPRDHQRVAGRRRVDVHERDGVLVGVDHLARHVAGDDPAEEAVVGHARSLSAESPRQLDRLLAGRRPRRRTGRLELREQLAEARPGLDPELRRQLVAGQERPRRPRDASRAPAASISRGQLQVRLDHLGARERALAAGGEAVGDGQQGDVGADGLGRAQVLVDPPRRQRALVDEEAEPQVVQRSAPADGVRGGGWASAAGRSRR